MSTKAQVWSMDFFVALIIFMLAIMFFYRYTLSSIDYQKDVLENLKLDAQAISENLMTEGLPEGWDKDDAVRAGLVDKNLRINETKVQYFKEIRDENYLRARRLIGTNKNFYINFVNKNNTQASVNGIEEIGSLDTNAENIVKVTRFVRYDSEIIRMEVYTW